MCRCRSSIYVRGFVFLNYARAASNKRTRVWVPYDANVSSRSGQTQRVALISSTGNRGPNVKHDCAHTVMDVK